ncbi:MAG: hypothetical protein C3F08_01630 [Candidatus Methylomirabilota bacterium]|nr:MAG: hypothetical protein C3F08_01630 [candidate division NC10 bacterium]
MRASASWNTVTIDRTDFLERLISLLSERGIRYCVIGGQAVNAHAEPLVIADVTRNAPEDT